MQENHKIIKYPSRNIQTESYTLGEASVTKHYYDEKDAYVEKFITVENGVTEIKHITKMGVHSKVEYFVNEKRHGVETKYMISKADKTVKSTKTYFEGKLHGESITYNAHGDIIKKEVYSEGKLVSRETPLA